jgi:DNA-binding transcriptional ArsR family regulator
VSEAVVERLDLLIATVRLAWREQLEAERERVREDKLDAALLDATASDWVRSGDLQRKVVKSQKVTERAVRKHLAALLEQGLLRAQRDGKLREYRATGAV